MKRAQKASSARPPQGSASIRGLHGIASAFLLVAVALTVTAASATAAESCPNAAVRAQQRSSSLPECRAYEQVTPSEKNGNSTIGIRVPLANPIWPSRDGETVITYAQTGTQGDDPLRGAGLPLIDERTSNGWVSRNATPGFKKGTVLAALATGLRDIVPAADAKSLLVNTWLPFSPEASVGGVNIMRGETAEWVSRPTWAGAPSSVAPFAEFLPVGGSEDLSTVYFDGNPQLTAEDVGRSQELSELYRYEDGLLAPVPLPDGTAPSEGSSDSGFVPFGENMTGYLGGASQAYSRPVSADGKTVTFVSPNPNGKFEPITTLYISHVGEQTRQLTPTDTALPVGATGREWPPYAVNSSDGRYVVFASTADLTSAAEADPSGTRKVYRYDRAEPGSLTYLPEITMVDASPNGYGPVIAVSPDGSRILFGTEAGEVKLWRSGMSTLTVATEGFVSGAISAANFSGDESALVLMSSVPLAGAEQEPGTTQVYRFAEATGKLDCLSCLSGDTTSSAKFDNWILGGLPGSQASNLTMQGSQGISDDGQTVFFDTTAQLVPEDHNKVSDVYEWSDGTYGLISSGLVGASPSFFADSDPSGKNLYFYTRQNIGSDQDDLYDLYDARVDGGFLESPTTGAERCRGEECQGALDAPPATATPASTAIAGPGNLIRGIQVPRRLVARPGKVVLSVKTSIAGRIVVTSSSTKTLVRGVSGSGRARLPLRLTKAAQRKLSKRGRLAFRARVSFTPSVGTGSSATVAISVTPRAGKGR